MAQRNESLKVARFKVTVAESRIERLQKQLGEAFAAKAEAQQQVAQLEKEEVSA